MRVTLYCKPYVASWLVKNYGNPVKLPRKSTFRYTFLTCLTKKFYPSAQYDLKKYTAQVEFTLYEHQLFTYGHTVDVQLEHHINSLIEEQVKNEMYLYVFGHIRHGVTIDKAVQLYQMNFGFTDEVFSLEAIRKAYMRRDKLYKNIFSGTVPTT